MSKPDIPNLYRIPARGGILSPGELLRIIALARRLGLDGLHFGSRQDVLLSCSAPPREVLADFADLTVDEVRSSPYANIVCSYASAGIFPKTTWLTSSSYLYILEQFSERPRLEVNITDPRQRLTPLFAGHLNFIASAREDYWYLYVRMPEWPAAEPFPALVHTWDIGAVVSAIEKGGELPDLSAVVVAANTNGSLRLRNVEAPLSVPFQPFPYYEGMNRQDNAHYWLGLYWRNNNYDLDFMEAACNLCLEHRIGKICVTSWKSFIVQGIPAGRRLEWEKLLGRFGINARHSSLELNWHLPVADNEALALKYYLVRAFDQRDISTYGLTFGVSSGYSRPTTSIVIDRAEGGGVVDGFAVRPTYNVQYARNFDPNTRQYVEYARQVDRTELVELMVELSRLYFEQLAEEPAGFVDDPAGKNTVADTAAAHGAVFRCSACQSVYDPALGDPDRGVAPGTPPAELPADYGCWTCGAQLSAFEVVATSPAV